MTNINYTVYVKEKGGFEEIKAYNTKSIKTAIGKAKEFSEEYNDKNVYNVYIEFFRKSDGQVGYINPDGAGITGVSWTE